MDSTEKVQALVERAEKLGVRLEFDCDLLFANRAPAGDPESQDKIIEELVKYLRDVRALVKGRSLAARAKDFFGQRIFFQDGANLSPEGQGVLSGVLSEASSNGLLTISVMKEEFRTPQMSTAKAESLLIVLDEKEADGAASPQNEESKSQQPRRGFFDRLRGPRAV